MNLIVFPDQETFDAAVTHDDPLLLLVAYDRSETLAACVDDALEHIILLRRIGRSELDIDSFFRVVVNRSGADWTFVAPSGYRGIRDRERRIEAFYEDGIEAITQALKLIGYDCTVRIPDRYRRHWDAMRSE